MTTYYELLQVAPTATAEEIKQAFRRIIARYHPDKVQHLGAEFQELAQERSAELTIAYKTLVDPEARGRYDQGLRLSVRESGSPEVRTSESRSAGQPSGSVTEGDCHGGGGTKNEPARSRSPFDHVRQESDALLKRAVLAHVDQVVGKALPQSERPTASGFDLAYHSKPRLFGSAPPLVLVRFVPRLDVAALQELWTLAARASVVRKSPACVLALTADIASQRELATVIAANQARSANHASITVVPVNVRTWHAWIPQDAHPTVKQVARGLAGR